MANPATGVLICETAQGVVRFDGDPRVLDRYQFIFVELALSVGHDEQIITSRFRECNSKNLQKPIDRRTLFGVLYR